MTDEPTCSFCGKSRLEVISLIAGPDCFICDECVGACVETLYAEQPAPSPVDVPAVRAGLEARVVGQERAKRAIAAALAQRDLDGDGLAPRVLLVGGSGTGKSTLLRAAVAIAGCPAYVGHAGRLSQTGYVGDDVEHLVYGVLRAASHHPPACERGLLAVDGLESLRAEAPLSGDLRDVCGASVQRELARLLDGQVLHVPPNGQMRHPQAPGVRIDTRRIVVVAALRAEVSSELGGLELRDALCRAGYLEAMIWRFDRIVRLDRLASSELSALLAAPHGPLAEAAESLRALGASVELDGAARAALVHAAERADDGAWALRRGTRRMMEEVVLDPSPARVHRFGALDAQRWIG